LAVALLVPAGGLAHHIVTSATVTARLKERRSTDFWTVEFRWTANCQGAEPGTAWYDGDLYMVDADTGERIYVGGVVDTSGQRTVTHTLEWFVSSAERERRLLPELTINCFQNFPLHGGPDVTTSGEGVFIPPRLSGGGHGGVNGDYGSSGDPTRPPAAGGCVVALVGTNERDTLTGGAGGDVVFGLGAGDQIRGSGGHDCLIGGSGGDLLRGEAGSDRLTGGRGNDVLVGGPGVNAYDAGSGSDFVDARNGKRELVRCGSGRDRARVDRRDRVSRCERVSRPR
jgi:Ca2+-binding RTX toxin-like protein